MCRVRFGLTDIHFEELQPNFPRSAYYRASVAASPCSGESRLGPLLPVLFVKQLDAAKKAMVAPESSPPKKKAASNVDWQINKQIKRRKRKHSAKATSWKRLASSSQSSTPSSLSGGGTYNSRFAKSTKRKIPASAFADCAKLSNVVTPLQHTQIRETASVAASLKVSRKAPPAKRVRFAMDLKTAGPHGFPLYAEDDSSETHSSQESMIDPGPFPPYPIGGFGRPHATGSTGSSWGEPTTGISAGRNIGSMTEPSPKSPTQPRKAQSTQTPKEWSPVLSRRSSTASLSETPDVYSGSYCALDAPRSYQKKEVPNLKSSAKSNSKDLSSRLDSLNARGSAQISEGGKPSQQWDVQHKGKGIGGLALNSKGDAGAGVEEEREEATSESESETEDGAETSSKEGAQLVAQGVLLTSKNGELSVRPNKESRFAKLRPARKLPNSVLKAGSKLFGMKGKVGERAKSKIARSPSVSAIDEEVELK